MSNVTCFYMSFVHIIMYLDMLIREVMGEHGLGLITRLTMKRNEDNQRGMVSTFIGMSIPWYRMTMAAMCVVQPLKRIKRD